jgi:methylthioribulose-1-phosphate dehydratase
MEFSVAANRLAEIGHGFYRRGWMLGTSGNLSAVSGIDPLRLAITSSGVDKGALSPGQILQVDETGTVVEGVGRPSDETALHLSIVRKKGAGAVLHTHSVWGTLVSSLSSESDGISIEGYEMLKGLAGIKTHEHIEWLPIIDNSQDIAALAGALEHALDDNPECHGVLIRGHGLYSWGKDLTEATRHIEILEFLIEVFGRLHSANASYSF